MRTVEFIDKYNAARNKNDFLSKNVIKRYVPYEEKIVRCENIVKNTWHTDIKDKERFVVNSPLQYMLFSLTLVDLYTDIDVDFENKKNLLIDFNMLEEADLINLIASAMPQREYERFKGLLNMIKDDYVENNRTIMSFIESNMTALGDLATSIQSENINESL